MNERDSRMFDSLAFSRFLFLYRFSKRLATNKKEEKKKRKEKARDGRKLSMHIYHMNERVLVPTLPCILLLSTDYLSIVPRVLKPRKNKKGTKIRTKQFPIISIETERKE